MQSKLNLGKGGVSSYSLIVALVTLVIFVSCLSQKNKLDNGVWIVENEHSVFTTSIFSNLRSIRIDKEQLYCSYNGEINKEFELSLYDETLLFRDSDVIFRYNIYDGILASNDSLKEIIVLRNDVENHYISLYKNTPTHTRIK